MQFYKSNAVSNAVAQKNEVKTNKNRYKIA